MVGTASGDLVGLLVWIYIGAGTLLGVDPGDTCWGARDGIATRGCGGVALGNALGLAVGAATGGDGGNFVGMV
jgi:hypothetical protein